MAENVVIDHKKRVITIGDYDLIKPKEEKQITLLGRAGYAIKTKRETAKSAAKNAKWYEERLTADQFARFEEIQNANGTKKGFFNAVAYVRDLAAGHLNDGKKYNELVLPVKDENEEAKPDKKARAKVNKFIEDSGLAKLTDLV